MLLKAELQFLLQLIKLLEVISYTTLEGLGKEELRSSSARGHQM